MIRNLRFFCQRVLPVVYDDSLSFQELLYKVVAKLNEVINVTNDTEAAIEADVREILNEWMEDGTLDYIINTQAFSKLKFFYVPEDSEKTAAGDGITDCTDAFDQLCEWINTDEDGIRAIFIPANKTYRITHTIALPENSILFGTGETSVIYYDETNTRYGTAIAIGGSNIVIDNVNIQHRTDTQITGWGSMTGAVGVGTLTHCGKIVDGVPFVHKDNHDITITNLYCTRGRYALQTEPDTEHTVSNVKVNGVYAPDSLVSIAAKNADHSIINCEYSNIICDVFRAGNGAGKNENVSVNNFYCKYLRGSDTGFVFNNGIVDGTQTTILDSDVHAGYTAIVKSGNVFNNVTFDGSATRTKGMQLYRISSENSGEYVFNNCKFNNFSLLANNTIGTTIGYMYLNQCDMDTVTIPDTVKYIVKGGTVPFKQGTNTYPKIYEGYNDTTSGSLMTTDLSFIWNYSRIVGDMYMVSALIDLTGFTDGDTILSFAGEVPVILQINCFGFESTNHTARALHVTRSSNNLILANALGMDRILVNFTSPIVR